MIEIIQGDITQAKTQAIVNAANEDLILGSGVAGSILRTGGETIQEACNRLAPIKEGEAVLTTAGKLPHDYVIHAVAPNGEIDGWEALITNCMHAILTLCEQHEIASVAIPALGTGVFDLPAKRVAELLTHEARSFHGEHLKRVVFVLFDEESLFWFNKANAEN